MQFVLHFCSLLWKTHPEFGTWVVLSDEAVLLYVYLFILLSCCVVVYMLGYEYEFQCSQFSWNPLRFFVSQEMTGVLSSTASPLHEQAVFHTAHL